MNKVVLVITILIANLQCFNHLFCQISAQMHDLFSLSSTTTWREYSLNAPLINFHKEKWAWTCSLTFKSKEPIKLDKLTLQWKGAKLPNLAAALYLKKEREEVLIPIQQNLVCEGTWNPQQQQLVFTPDEKIIAVNKYYLMISFPKEIETQIKQGKFSILNTHLSKINQQSSTATAQN
jgi:hypothetical protein